MTLITKEDTQATWRAMEELQSLGVVRSLGVSIFSPEQAEWILENASSPIDVFQILYQVQGHNNTLLEWTKAHGIQLRSRIEFEYQDSVPAIDAAAKAHNVSTMAVELRWLLQLGLPISACPPTESKIDKYLEAYDFTLTAAEMKSISLCGCSNLCDLTGECGSGDSCSSLLKTYSCKADYCPTCRWAGWCDKECGVGTCEVPKAHLLSAM